MSEVTSIFQYDEYRLFLKDWVTAKGKYGALGRWAKALNVSSTLISFVMSGKNDLTLEQATDLAEHLHLNEQETEYFLLLVEISRSGTSKYKNRLLGKKEVLQNKSRQISAKVGSHQELSQETMGVFYSSWLYSAVRILSAIPSLQEPDLLAEHLDMPIENVQKILDFLVQNNLCRQENGKISYGPARTHVSKESPHVTKHHQNWRLRGTQAMDRRLPDDLFFTAPMALSKEAAEKIRALLLEQVDQAFKIAGPADSEEAYCLNIDWFKM